jgi:hypothetical protein
MGNRRLLAAAVMAAFAAATPALTAAPASASTGNEARRTDCWVVVYSNGHYVQGKCRTGVKRHNRYRIVADFCTEHGCRWITGNTVRAPHWSHVSSSGYYAGHVKIVAR